MNNPQPLRPLRYDEPPTVEPAGSGPHLRNHQRRVGVRREELLPAIEKTAQHLFARIEDMNFEQGTVELMLPSGLERLSIRVSQISPKVCLVNILSSTPGMDLLSLRSRSNVRQFFHTLRLFLPKSKVY